MLLIKEFKDLLPFTDKNTGLTLKLIDLKHRDLYINNMLTDEYCKYNKVDFKSIGRKELTEGYLNLLKIYKLQKYAESIRMIVMDNDKCIGGAAVYSQQNEEITLGYFVLSKYMSLGYGTKILCILKKYVCSLIRLGVIKDNIFLEINRDNIRSIKVAEANGFTLIKNNSDILKYKM
ncbi:MAG: GNAT family N-acetyltransferase [Lachnospiraceae bacterium]|nr:GNAT family N-acetyltransferase [Lachnospiraceae bacterium]